MFPQVTNNICRYKFSSCSYNNHDYFYYYHCYYVTILLLLLLSLLLGLPFPLETFTDMPIKWRALKLRIYQSDDDEVKEKLEYYTIHMNKINEYYVREGCYLIIIFIITIIIISSLSSKGFYHLILVTVNKENCDKRKMILL